MRLPAHTVLVWIATHKISVANSIGQSLIPIVPISMSTSNSIVLVPLVVLR